MSSKWKLKKFVKMLHIGQQPHQELKSLKARQLCLPCNRKLSLDCKTR